MSKRYSKITQEEFEEKCLKGLADQMAQEFFDAGFPVMERFSEFKYHTGIGKDGTRKINLIWDNRKDIVKGNFIKHFFDTPVTARCLKCKETQEMTFKDFLDDVSINACLCSTDNTFN